ncbi:hypothetical protein [Brevibacillus brevis]|uniref:hypothetical protein n=1 Tax=Brevibacillus brevis TaxID=1393 RepID=UPI00165DBB3D|nr:hypothetical protein [Brevibacillus brevis]
MTYGDKVQLVEVSDSVSKLVFGYFDSQEQAKEAVRKSDKAWWEGKPVYKEIEGEDCSI